MAEPEQAPNDGSDGGPWLSTLSFIFGSAATLLLLPRQYWAAGASMAVALLLAAVHRLRRRPPDKASAPSQTAEPRAEADK